MPDVVVDADACFASCSRNRRVRIIRAMISTYRPLVFRAMAFRTGSSLRGNGPCIEKLYFDSQVAKFFSHVDLERLPL